MKITKDVVRKEITAFTNSCYQGSIYWKALAGALLVLFTAPVIIPTRLVYRLYKAVKTYGL